MPNYQYEHVHIISADPEKTAQFYIKYLGAREEGRMNIPGMFMVRLSLNGGLILITSGDQPANYGLDHFGLTTDNLDESVKELKAAGCRFKMEPTQIAPGTRIAFFWTPEDVLIELVETKG